MGEWYFQPSKMKLAFVSVVDVPPSTFPFSSSSSSTLSSFRNVFHIKYPAGSKTKNKIRAFKDKKFCQPQNRRSSMTYYDHPVWQDRGKVKIERSKLMREDGLLLTIHFYSLRPFYFRTVTQERPIWTWPKIVSCPIHIAPEFSSSSSLSALPVINLGFFGSELK